MIEFIESMSDALLVLLGFLLGLVPGWWTRRSRLKVHWASLRAEIELCQEKAQTYLTANVMAPLYRFPTKAYETSFPVLLTDAAVDEQSIRNLLRFYSLVEDINRGLDNAAQLASTNNAALLQTEYLRNRSKVEQLTKPISNVSNLYSEALGCVNSHIN